MILTPHRPVHYPPPSPSSTTSSSSSYTPSGIYFRPQPISPGQNISTSHRGVVAKDNNNNKELKRPLSQRTLRGMAATDSQRKRRATSPTYSTRATSSAQLAIHRHHLINDSFGTISLNSIRAHPEKQQQLPNPRNTPNVEHIVELSSIEQCMPRAYIRVCLAYRAAASEIDEAIERLNRFVRHTVDAKPYLSGYVMPVDGSTRTGPVEIRFTNEDYEHYPRIAVGRLYEDNGELMDYEELDQLGFPPSKLHPEKVADLPATIADEKRAPVFRAQANIINGGLVVSLYLHHCVSDGTGLGILTMGSIKKDKSAFRRQIIGQSNTTCSLAERLARFATQKTIARQSLCFSPPNQITNRTILSRRFGEPIPSNPPGRGCVISIPFQAIVQLRSTLSRHQPGVEFSRHDVLQALVWRHMVRARIPVVRRRSDISTSKLLIPVNIRGKMKPDVPETYFGAAVDFASATFNIDAFANNDEADLARAAKIIKDAVAGVDDAYVRQAIALSRSDDPSIDVRDLLAANIDRVTGADLYITSWERLELYNATLDMGIGTPDWVRKPWSRDPGSCIILPRNHQKEQFEVTIQMTEDDMSRLLQDQDFMKYVSRVID